jgi:predicted AlkP superfamily pyrophosphatase or phosphodiesterase
MKGFLRSMAWFLILAVTIAGRSGATGEDQPKSSMVSKGYLAVVPTMPPGATIAAAGAQGSLAPRCHLVNPGMATTFRVRLQNPGSAALAVELAVSDPAPGWAAQLAETTVKLDPGAARYVEVKLAAGKNLAPGSRAAATVKARGSNGLSGEIVLAAETTAKHKIYIVSIDSLGPEYLALNARGNGPGREGDWLMPNLKSLVGEGTFFPNHRAHLVAATDMNHASYLSGAYPGRLGLYSVNAYLFGFDAKGAPIFRTTPLDLMYYGAQGEPVTTLFNVVKDPVYGGDPKAFTTYISGKDWVPEHYRNPLFGLDRIVTINDRPDYVAPYEGERPQMGIVRQTIQVMLSQVKDPDLYLWEDRYTVDQALQVIAAEDPEVVYLLLGGVDAAGHIYGSGHDLEEWDTRGTPDDLSDDRSKINSHANRLGIVKTVKNADRELGRLLDFLRQRGAYENSIIVVESDHNMETATFASPPIRKILQSTGLSDQTDYYVFTGSQLGAVFLRRDDPAILPRLEQALESYRVKNPWTGRLECPLLAITKEEMKTGIDQVTGDRVTRPLELYSEYYLEHPKPGGLRYPDMMLFTKKHYQFPVVGVGLANVGVPLFNLPLPPVSVHVGAHGGPSTQPALLSIRGPGIPPGVSRPEVSQPADLVPFLCRFEQYVTPKSVQGKGLPIGP